MTDDKTQFEIEDQDVEGHKLQQQQPKPSVRESAPAEGDSILYGNAVTDEDDDVLGHQLRSQESRVQQQAGRSLFGNTPDDDDDVEGHSIRM